MSLLAAAGVAFSLRMAWDFGRAFWLAYRPPRRETLTWCASSDYDFALPDVQISEFVVHRRSRSSTAPRIAGQE